MQNTDVGKQRLLKKLWANNGYRHTVGQKFYYKLLAKQYYEENVGQQRLWTNYWSKMTTNKVPKI